MPRRLLIVDDDPTIRASLSEALADNGTTEVRVAEGPHRALAMLDVAAPDVVLSDVRMPDMDGIAASPRTKNDLAVVPATGSRERVLAKYDEFINRQQL